MDRFLTIIVGCLLSLVIKAQGQELTFISQDVEDGIRQHLNISEEDQISFQQLDTITRLDLSKRGITDIRDLVLLPKLRVLDLSDNRVDDLQPLTVLDSLEWVDLSYNNLKGINDLFYSSAKNLNINVAFNYIKDFSLFGSISSCNFTLDGAELQMSAEAPYYDVYHFYTYFVEDDKPVIAYRGYTNIELANTVNCASSNIQVWLDGDSYVVVLPETPTGTAKVTLTNGKQNETTYIVPPADFKVGAGNTVTLETGLPDDYFLKSAYASKGTVEIVGNMIKYTASEKVVSDILYFSYYQGSELKGLSRFYLNRVKKGDVNGDGAVDKTDLDMVVSYVMNPSDDFNKYAADINNDDKVDVADIVLIVKMIKNY